VPQPSPEGTRLTPEDEQKLRTEKYAANRRRAGQLLLVGAVGYMLGRRRGRIRTEERMQPIQDKLEKEVKSLHDKVAEREDKIRQLAAEKVLQQPETARPQLVERIQARAERRRQATEQPVAARRPEGMGRFALPGAERAAVTPERREKSLNTMTVNELLLIADRIEKDGVSVKTMYENGRLDAEGLRRVVKEFLEGRQLDRILSENLKQLESHEGQPLAQQARDQQAAGAAQSAGAFATPTAATQAAYRPGPPQPMSTQYPMPQPKQSQSLVEDKTTIAAMGVVAAVLIALIIVLFS
jgi:hypothetical protein